MDRMLMVVFDSVDKAYQAADALEQLDRDGEIAIYAAAVVSKGDDGAVHLGKQLDAGAWDSASGLVIGSLIGLLGGPLGMMAGGAAGTMVGAAFDLSELGVDAGFLQDASKALMPGKSALVASIEEAWTTPVDTRMGALAGAVYRRARAEVGEEQYLRELAAEQAEIDRLKAELAQANAERKVGLQARYEVLKSRLETKRAQLQTRREAIRRDVEAKIRTLEAKAAQARAGLKAKWSDALVKLKADYHRRIERLKV